MMTEYADFLVTDWRKAEASDNQGECVEIAARDGRVGVRDSKHPAGGMLVFHAAAFAAFTAGVRAGNFD